MVLKGPGLAVCDFSEPNAHGGPLIERPAGLARGGQLSSQADADPQLLTQLPVQGGFGCFVGFHFAAGELPHAGELRGCCPPGYQQAGWPDK